MRDKRRTMKGFACIPISDPYAEFFDKFIDIRIDRIESMKPVTINEKNLTLISMFSGAIYYADCSQASLKFALETQEEE